MTVTTMTTMTVTTVTTMTTMTMKAVNHDHSIIATMRAATIPMHNRINHNDNDNTNNNNNNHKKQQQQQNQQERDLQDPYIKKYDSSNNHQPQP